MIEWSDEDLMIRDAVRDWIDAEVRPNLDALESGELPPYDIIRGLYKTFGMDEMARSSFRSRMEKERAGDAGKGDADDGTGRGGNAAMSMLPIIELCKVAPGLVSAMGVGLGLAAGTIMKRGTVEQKERWALDLLTMEKVGAWAITEPNSGSDAFGGMQATARRSGDEYVLNGSKTFITNGPYADTIVFYCKLDEEGVEPRDREILTFVLDTGMDGLEQSRPLRKMGLHSSPTGELFLNDVRAGADRLLSAGKGGGKESAKQNFVTERAGVAAMALGVIEECLKLSVEYAKTRELWGQRIGDFQLIQLKLAKMEVARLNVQNLVFRHVEMQRAGRAPTLAEASAMKLYAAQAASEVAQEAVQLFGGNGYMSEYRVEQLARDAKSFQIYAGTDEIQVTHIARDLLSR
ncbi:acyl-CoA dehydrogenase family protein [Actinomadura algeriensis]|uniref:Alkylation response protein AidB-like acyl-CoA dehydrogenase n=1 Tax=Actinomadura algeriensis TaxID=1679523 RepID=A0ABR9K0A5_9ACTN|nr:acyl-CoA dehydrogenase family protein [Actinomadura algeriensis]MBE1536261.1 alkylation response protein AidB-like acyl-CoA dehydrogenase [Actinomadura algeriensis]